MITESDRSPRDDLYDRALARWEWEGGHMAGDKETPIPDPDPRKEKRPDPAVASRSH
jgi:hypothetical protein